MLEGIYHLRETLKRLGNYRSSWVALLVMIGLAFAEHLSKRIIDSVDPPWTAVEPALNLCVPSNLAELKSRQVVPCQIQAGRIVALMDLPNGLTVHYDAPPRSFFKEFQLDGVMLLKKGASGLQISAVNSDGVEFGVDNSFVVVDPISPEGSGEGNENARANGSGIPAFFEFSSGNRHPLPKMQNSVDFPGYSTFSRPDFELFSMRADEAGLYFAHTLVQSFGNHPSVADIDAEAGAPYQHRAAPVPFGRIVAIRITAHSTDKIPGDDKVTVRLDALRQVPKDIPTQSASRIVGTVQTPKGIRPEDVLVHVEPIRSKWIAREVAAARVDSDSAFSTEPVPPGEFEIWAEARAEDGQLFTGNCAVNSNSAGVSWLSRNPQTQVPRATRTRLDDCRQGKIVLVPSPDKDKFMRRNKKRSASTKPTYR